MNIEINLEDVCLDLFIVRNIACVQLYPFIQSNWSYTCGCENMYIVQYIQEREGAAIIVTAST